MERNSNGRARDIVGAEARGCSIMGSSEDFFFFLIVLVVCSDTYRSFVCSLSTHSGLRRASLPSCPEREHIFFFDKEDDD